MNFVPFEKNRRPPQKNVLIVLYCLDLISTEVVFNLTLRTYKTTRGVYDKWLLALIFNLFGWPEVCVDFQAISCAAFQHTVVIYITSGVNVMYTQTKNALQCLKYFNFQLQRRYMWPSTAIDIFSKLISNIYQNSKTRTVSLSLSQTFHKLFHFNIFFSCHIGESRVYK